MSSTIPATCSACGHVHMLDPVKYGGKKIKCRKCQAIVMVQEAATGDLAPETLGDGNVLDKAAAVLAAKTLNKHRTASQRAVVNIALLKRQEESREEIRDAFMELYGDEVVRIPDSVIPILKAKRLATEELEEQRYGDRIKDLERLIQLYAVKGPPSSGLTTLRREWEFLRSDNDKLYEQAVALIGGPIEPTASKAPPPPAASGPLPFGGGLLGSLVANVGKAMESAGIDRKNPENRIPTLKAAVAVLGNMQEMQEDKIRQCEQQYDAIIEEHEKKCRQQLGEAEEMLAAGKNADATGKLDVLLRQAPPSMLSRVVAMLGMCAYLSGNPTAAAQRIQEAVCFGASAPTGMDDGFNDLWAKASAGLPRT